MDIATVGYAVLVGITAGFASGLLGIGGGFIFVPALMFLVGVDIHTAIATSLLAIVFTTFAGGLTHVKRGNVSLASVPMLAWTAVIGANLGAMVALGTEEVHLRYAFGLLNIAASLKLLFMDRKEKGMAKDRSSMTFVPRKGHKDRGKADYRRFLNDDLRHDALLGVSWYTMAPFGFIVGFVSSLLGIGGGIIMVPFLCVIFGFPIKRAIGTSSVTIFFIAMAGVLRYSHSGEIDLAAGIIIGVLSMCTAAVGAQVVSKVSSRSLRRGFVLFQWFVALKIFGVLDAIFGG